jgi:hypothetical protein
MGSPSTRHAVAFLAALCVGGCNRSPSASSSDAGQTAKPVRVRPPARPGETLADLTKSKVTLTTIKDKDTVSPVVANVSLRDGAVTLGESPSARLTLDLDTFDSAIPLRNQRVRLVFFETTAVGWDVIEIVVAKIPDAVVAALKDKKSASGAKLDAIVEVHGKKVSVPLTVDASYVGDRLVVKSTAPIEVRISDSALGDNLRRLSALCMHDSIDDVVKVDATIEFGP